MATLTYVILRRRGPSTSLTNPNGSAVQTSVTTYDFEVSCSFHPGGHTVTVGGVYTLADIENAVNAACGGSYKAAPEIGTTWTQVI